jgi:uncharacterized iron-regulated protein
MKRFLLTLLVLCFSTLEARADWRDAGGESVSEDALVHGLATSRFVLLGEVHDNPEHHQIQARLLQSMIAEGRRPAVVWEMIPIERQVDIDRVLARTGPGRGAFALAEAVGWSESGWPNFALYAPIMKAAMDADLPILAGGVSRETAMEIMGVGIDAFVEGRGWSQGPIGETARAVQLDAVFEGHCRLMPRERLEPMLDIQVARDIAMAEVMVAAVGDGADGAVLIAGHGHVRADAGVPLHLARLSPDASVAAIGVLEHAGEVPPPVAPRFSYVKTTAPIQRPDPCEALRKRFGEHQGKKPAAE